jgi:putative ABC transport system permease protein
MRAIGASDGAIMRIIIGEGILIGLISWLIGVGLSFPLSNLLSDAVGQSFLNAPLNQAYSARGAILWLGVIACMSAAASYLPARRAARLTVREVLSYEG